MRMVFHQLQAEQRMFWRSREAAIFVFLFPLLLYSLLASVYSDEITLGGKRFPAADVLLAGLFCYGAANTAFAGLAIILVGRRETGTLKRLRATPLSPTTYIVAVILSTLIVFSLQTVALLVLAQAFGAHTPDNVVGFAGAIVIGIFCFAAMGLAAAALIRSADGASAVVNLVLLPMAFLSGSFGPTRHFGSLLRAVSDVLPLTYFLKIVNGVYLDGDSLFAKPGALAVIAAWGVAGVFVARRNFSWMPREA